MIQNQVIALKYSHIAYILYNMVDSKNHKTFSNFDSDIISCTAGNKILKTKRHYQNDLFYIITDDKEYKTYIGDIAMSVKDRKVYKGASTYYSSDVLTKTWDQKSQYWKL